MNSFKHACINIQKCILLIISPYSCYESCHNRGTTHNYIKHKNNASSFDKWMVNSWSADACDVLNNICNYGIGSVNN